MKHQLQSTTEPALPVDHPKPQSSKKTKPYTVLVVYSQCDASKWGCQAALRILDVQATGKREAKALASDLLRNLDLEQIDSITVDAHELGYDLSDPEILDVWKTRDIPSHAWTRAEIESEDFCALVNQAAAQLANGDEQPLLKEASL